MSRLVVMTASIKGFLGNIPIIDRFIMRCHRQADISHFLKKSKRNQFSRHVVVWDQSASPPTLGDLIEVLMLARWIANQGLETWFVILTGENRSDWSKKNNEQALQLELINRLTKQKNIKVQEMTWDTFSLQFLCDIKTYVVYRKRVENRKGLYTDSLKLLNNLVEKSGEHLSRSWLLTSSELSSSDFKNSKVLKSRNYVAWGVRHREVAPERNTGENEFRLLYLSLVNRASGLPIVVVSDRESCEFFRKVAQKFNLNCLFSCDFSESFLDDASIAIGGKVFFQIRGGGLGEVALYSNQAFDMSYVLIGPREMFKNSKVTAWQTSEQVFFELKTDDMSMHLPKFDLRKVRGSC